MTILFYGAQPQKAPIADLANLRADRQLHKLRYMLTTTFFVFYVGDQLLYIEEHTETVRGCVHDTFGGMTGIFNV